VYDARNEAHEFIAEGREAAVTKAVSFFGVDADALVVKEYAESEVSGLAGRTVIVAVPRDRKPSRERERPRSRERSGPRERGERGGRDRDRGGRGRGDREERGGRRERPAAARPPREPAEPSVGTPRGELDEPGKFLLGVIERLDVGPFEIGMSEEGELRVYEIAGAAAKGLSGADGRPIDALQLVVNQAAMHMEDDPKRIVLDVEGNPEARERFLSRLAERVVRRAREGGRSIALDPMSPRDRRMIHLAVRGQDGMATMSMGDGRYRQVVIVPEGAPEYAEAVKQSEQAQRGD
jgi:spoIIIJ-associated protein